MCHVHICRPDFFREQKQNIFTNKIQNETHCCFGPDDGSCWGVRHLASFSSLWKVAHAQFWRGSHWQYKDFFQSLFQTQRRAENYPGLKIPTLIMSCCWGLTGAGNITFTSRGNEIQVGFKAQTQCNSLCPEAGCSLQRWISAQLQISSARPRALQSLQVLGNAFCCFCSTPRVFQLPALILSQLTSAYLSKSNGHRRVGAIWIICSHWAPIRSQNKQTHRHSLTSLLYVCVSWPQAFCETNLCAAGGNRLSQERNEPFVFHLDSPPS